MTALEAQSAQPADVRAFNDATLKIAGELAHAERRLDRKEVLADNGRADYVVAAEELAELRGRIEAYEFCLRLLLTAAKP